MVSSPQENKELTSEMVPTNNNFHSHQVSSKLKHCCKNILIKASTKRYLRLHYWGGFKILVSIIWAALTTLCSPQLTSSWGLNVLTGCLQVSWGSQCKSIRVINIHFILLIMNPDHYTLSISYFFSEILFSFTLAHHLIWVNLTPRLLINS